MPIWISQYGAGILRWLGLSNDATAPNLGAFVLVIAFVLLAMGYTPEQMGGWLDSLGAMWSNATEFATKSDNLIGIVLGFLGLRMVSPAKPPA
jgi:hypothetical protein